MKTVYKEIESYIRMKIEDHTYKEGESIPTERELCDLFKVSRMTIRHAVDELIQEGLLIRKKGSGTYVSPPKLKHNYSKLSLSHDDRLIRNENIVSRVLSLELVNGDAYAMESLEIDEHEYVWKLKRIRMLKNQPMAYETIYFPQKYFPIARKEDFLFSFHDYMIAKCPFPYENNLAQPKVLVESSLAYQNTAKLLQIPVGSALLCIKIVTILGNGLKLNCSINFFPGDSFQFEINN